MDFYKTVYTELAAPQVFNRSLRETGFAVLQAHPIPKELIAGVYQEWQAFFAGSAKFDYRFDPQRQSGYFPYRTEQAKGYHTPDLKEFFHLYPKTALPRGMSDRTWELYHALHCLAQELLGWLEMRADFLREAIANSQETLLRILHYPPLPDQVEPGAVRAAAHEDINLITLLPAATGSGLEVLDNAGVWHRLPCEVGEIVVNVGDMLQLATDGYYRSTTHRVVNPADDRHLSRYSMPLFLHPRPEVELADGITAKAYLEQRLREIKLKN